jgi:hypothetical protein
MPALSMLNVERYVAAALLEPVVESQKIWRREWYVYRFSIIQIDPHTAEKGYVIIKPAYEVRPRKDHRGVDLISDALPFGRLWYTKRDDAVDYEKSFSRLHNAVIRVLRWYWAT